MPDNDEIAGFHAHVYWTNPEERERAAEIREEVQARFKVTMGSWVDRPVGPHPRHSYQIAFRNEEFGKIIPWLMLNRRDLVIFVHPITDDAYLDHRDHPLWLGEKLTLDLSSLPRKYTDNQAGEIPKDRN